MDMYKRLNLLGEGTFGKVYRGVHKQFGTHVALKYITKAGKTEKARAEVNYEIDLLKSFNHPKIVKLLDTFETPEDYCLVTEVAEGDLETFVAAGKALPEEVVRNLGAQIISALAYLHRHSIIHRDVKPANFLRFADGSIKICDFGIALDLPSDGYVRDCHKGTTRYMAPEVLNCSAYSLPADIYALGVSLYELLAGFSPYEYRLQGDILERILHGEIQCPPSWSSDMVHVLQWMLSKKPEDRPTVVELSEHPIFRGAVNIPMFNEPPDSGQSGWPGHEVGYYGPISNNAVPMEQVPLVAPINASQGFQAVSTQALLAQAKSQARHAHALAEASAAVAEKKALAAQQAQMEAEKAAVLNNQAVASYLLAQRHLEELEVLAHAQAGAPDDTLAVRIADVEAQEEALRGRSAAVSQREVEVTAREAAVKSHEEALQKREEAVKAAMQRGGAPIQLRGDSPQETHYDQLVVKKEESAEPLEHAMPAEEPSQVAEQDPGPNDRAQQPEACSSGQETLAAEAQQNNMRQDVTPLLQPSSPVASTHELSPAAAAAEAEAKAKAEAEAEAEAEGECKAQAQAHAEFQAQASKQQKKKKPGTLKGKGAKKMNGRPPWR